MGEARIGKVTLTCNVLLSVQLLLHPGLLPAPCLCEVVFLCVGPAAGQALREVIIALPPGAKMVWKIGKNIMWGP